MTLKETLQDYLHEPYATECEQLADEFAIEFAEWLFNIDKEALKKQLNHFKEERGI